MFTLFISENINIIFISENCWLKLAYVNWRQLTDLVKHIFHRSWLNIPNLPRFYQKPLNLAPNIASCRTCIARKRAWSLQPFGRLFHLPMSEKSSTRMTSLRRGAGERSTIEWTPRSSTEKASLWKHMTTEAVGRRATSMGSALQPSWRMSARLRLSGMRSLTYWLYAFFCQPSSNFFFSASSNVSFFITNSAPILPVFTTQRSIVWWSQT